MTQAIDTHTLEFEALRNSITQPAEKPSPAAPKTKDLLNQISHSATNLRDAIYAVQGLVAEPWWEGGMQADTARNALDWISRKMGEECDELHTALEQVCLKGRP